MRPRDIVRQDHEESMLQKGPLARGKCEDKAETTNEDGLSPSYGARRIVLCHCEPGGRFMYFFFCFEESRRKRIHVGYVAKQDWRTIMKRLLEHGDPHWQQQQRFDHTTVTEHHKGG